MKRKNIPLSIEANSVVCVLEANTMAENNIQHVHLIPFNADGHVVGVDGRAWHCNSESILAHAKTHPTHFAGDYFHASLDAATTGAKAPASGWIDPASLVLEVNGIWADVQWTEDAAQAIQNKEYKYISPVFSVNAQTQTILKLKGFGLTHYPNLGDLTPVANSTQESSMDEIIEEIREALNLPTASNAAEIKIELDKLFSRVGTLAANSQASLCDQVTLIETRVSAAEAIQTNSQTDTDAGAFVPRTEFDRVQTDLNSLLSQQKTARVDIAVNQALENGVITPASLPWAKDYCAKDAEGFAQFAANSVKVVPLGEENHSSTAGAGVLSHEETAVCAQLGIPHEDYLKSKAKEEH